MSDDDDRDYGRRGGFRGSSSRYDEDDDRGFRGSSSRGYGSSRWDEDDDRRGWNARNEPRDEYGRFTSGGSRGGWRGGSQYDDDDDYGRGRSRYGSSRRGFAGMDPEEQREIARRGGEAASRMEERDEYGRFAGYGSRGGGGYGYARSSRFDDDDDDRYGSRGGSRRGFASMDPEEHRRISSMGGRASHGGRYEDDDDDRYGSRGGRMSHRGGR
jgi:general stress protein YciG